MSYPALPIIDRLKADGFVLLPGVFTAQESAQAAAAIEAALATGGAAIRGIEGTVYAARNLLALWPPAADVWRRPSLLSLLAQALGPGAGLVRGLWFDKPPGQSWALPWHKDLTIAVRDNRLPSSRFRRPTAKAGVPHAEAPVEVLQRMLTLRLHLDDADDENGALRVQPGSHAAGKALAGEWPMATVEARAGDVLAMRPLLAHCSNGAREGTARHRRVLHLEFASGDPLGDGYEWHSFVPASGAA